MGMGSRTRVSRTSGRTIGSWDAAVDKTAVSWAPGYSPIVGDQSYHFNRNFSGGMDSRLAHMAHHFLEACKACNWTRLGNDNPDEAAKQLGISLHPLQDWVAHGDYGRHDHIPNGGIWIHHNWPSPQTPLSGKPDVALYPDDVELDAGGPDGRPVGAAIHLTWNGGEYAIYHLGTRRITLTRQRTLQKLSGFRAYVAAYGRPNCKCWQFFGIAGVAGGAH